MEGVQAAVLGAKLPRLDAWNIARRRHSRRNRELLADLPGLVLPDAPRPEAHVWRLFVVLVRGRGRDELRAALDRRGVSTAVHYPTPVPFQPAYAHLGYRRGDFPAAEDLMDCCLSLPMYPELTDEQIDHVAGALREALEPACVGSDAGMAYSP